MPTMRAFSLRHVSQLMLMGLIFLSNAPDHMYMVKGQDTLAPSTAPSAAPTMSTTNAPTAEGVSATVRIALDLGGTPAEQVGR